MRSFESDGINIAYEVSGKGRPFIFLHGLGGNAGHSLAAFGRADGYAVISADQRGHGKTPSGGKDKLCFKQLARDICALCNELGAERAVVGGISMGSAAALRFALDFPDMVEALVLVRPAWIARPMPRKIRKAYEKLYELRSRENFERTREYRRLNKKAPAVGRSLASLSEAGGDFEKYLAFPNDRPFGSLRELEKITVPTLVIATRQDPVHPLGYARRIAHRLKNARLFVICSKSKDEKRHAGQLAELIGRFLENC